MKNVVWVYYYYQNVNEKTLEFRKRYSSRTMSN